MLKKIIYLFLILLFASCGSDKTASLSTKTSQDIATQKVTLQTVLSEIDKEMYKEAELLVKFKPGVTPTISTSINNAIGSSLIKNLNIVANLQHVKLPAGLSVKDAIVRYMSDPNVEYAEPNYLFRPSIEPEDPFFTPQQWALTNLGFANGIPGADVRAPWAWDINKGSTNVIIAVLDTGIDYTHPDLVGNIWTNPLENPNNGIDDDGDGKIDDWRGWNFVFVDKNSNGICDRDPEDPSIDENCHDPYDDWGHGTHVAGITGAVGNNGFGVSGLMWHVRLMPLKVCDVVLGGCPLDAIEEGIGYAVLKNVKVINASLGGSVFSSSLQNAIQSANNAGILFVAAAGNDGTNNDLAPFYPASYNLPNIISVAASDQNDRLASFSNFGLNSVHVAAPGTYILSTVPLTGVAFSFSSLCTGSFAVGYDFCDGTSMAAPHVSGLAGLLYSYYSYFTFNQVKATILRYVDKLPAPNVLTQTRGRINAYRALSSLQTPTNLSAGAISSSEISLAWDGNATGEDGYKIERKTGTGSFIQIATIPAIARQNVIPQPPVAYSFTDSGLVADTTYTYRVRAFNTIPADSSFSNEASATTLSTAAPPPSPSSSDGGGGCSIGVRQNVPTAIADFAVLLMPLLLIALMRRKR